MEVVGFKFVLDNANEGASMAWTENTHIETLLFKEKILRDLLENYLPFHWFLGYSVVVVIGARV